MRGAFGSFIKFGQIRYGVSHAGLHPANLLVLPGDVVGFKKNFTLVMLDMLTLSRRTGIWPERDVI